MRPSGTVAKLLNMAIEIMDLSMKNGDLNHSVVANCQRVKPLPRRGLRSSELVNGHDSGT